MLFGGGYLFDRPIPRVTADGIEPYPPTGARKHDLRTLFFYGYTGITPAMAMRLTGLGSQYLVCVLRLEGRVLRRSEVVHVHTAARHPRGTVLVVHPLRQPDPLDARDAAAVSRGPAASRIRRPAAEANADGTTTVHFAPEQPAGVADGNWIQTMPGKGFFPVLRLYSPLQPFFDKSWRAGEVEPQA